MIVTRKMSSKLYESDLGDDGFTVFCMAILFFTLRGGQTYANAGKTVFEIDGLKVLVVTL